MEIEESADGERSNDAFPNEKCCGGLLTHLPTAYTTPHGLLTRKPGVDAAWRPSDGPSRESEGADVALMAECLSSVVRGRWGCFKSHARREEEEAET